MEKFEIEVCRIHKSSPWNCSLWYDEIEGESAEKAVDKIMPDVAKTFGKHFRVNVMSLEKREFFEFEILKQKAITA